MDREPVRRIRAVVLDFDGTLFQLFRHWDMAGLSAALRTRMEKYGVEFPEGLDGFEIFSQVLHQIPADDRARRTALLEADRILAEAERAAVDTGELVPGADMGLRRLREAGFRVGIATNNSPGCVEAFLEQYLPGTVLPVAGRVGDMPERMKPDPWTALRMLRMLDVPPEEAVLVGDSPRDFQCACAAGCGFLGMAPTRRKRERLRTLISEKDILPDFYMLLARPEFSGV